MPYGRNPASLQRCTTRSAIDFTWRSDVPLATTIVSVMSVMPRTSIALTLTAFMSASASSTTCASAGGAFGLAGLVAFATGLAAALLFAAFTRALTGALAGALAFAAGARR